ncbi:hypothetical protein JL721_3601 [Aureococcus anophagefferens]|nr:hypothetical protein JL721_3601 [Aureococcus anophagefferens]
MVDLGWVKVKMEVVDLRSVGSLEEMRHLLDAQLRGVCAHELAAPRAACVDEAFARVRGLVEGSAAATWVGARGAARGGFGRARPPGRLEALAADARSVLEHWSVSDLHLDVGAVDVVFIDTLHTYGQLRRELEKFGATTRSYIAIHDTEVDGQRGEALEGLEEHLSIERWEALDADTASFDTADLLKFAPLDLVRHPLPPTAAPDISVTALRAIIANQLGHSRIWERVAPSDDELSPPGGTYGGGDNGDDFEARRFDLLSQYAVIVQDDVRLAPDFAAGLEALAADLPHDAEVVWLGHDLCMHPFPPAVQFAARVTEHVHAASSAHSAVGAGVGAATGARDGRGASASFATSARAKTSSMGVAWKWGTEKTHSSPSQLISYWPPR